MRTTKCDDCVSQLKRKIEYGKQRTSKKGGFERICLLDMRVFGRVKGTPFEIVKTCTKYEQVP